MTVSAVLPYSLESRNGRPRCLFEGRCLDCRAHGGVPFDLGRMVFWGGSPVGRSGCALSPRASPIPSAILPCCSSRRPPSRDLSVGRTLTTTPGGLSVRAPSTAASIASLEGLSTDRAFARARRMLVVTRTSRREHRSRLAADLRCPRIPIRLLIGPGNLQLETVTWREYWQPCNAFLSADARLLQRLNRLKATWQDLSRAPTSRRRQLAYCWRYFGLAGTAAVHFSRDGFNTEAHHYVVAPSLLVENLAGERLW